MGETNQSTTPSTLAALASPQPCGSHALGKRQRNDDNSSDATSTSTTANTKFLQRLIEKQNAEIQNLRVEKASKDSTIHNMTQNQEKLLHENKILKKAVALQQHRQNQSSTE